jgi:hypothetical protein
MYPIIRRKRRPLVVEEIPPAALAPVQPVATKPLVEPVLADGHQPAPEQPKVTDAKSVPQDESY